MSDRIYEFNRGGWLCLLKRKRGDMLLPVELRLEILRMEYLRWVEEMT